MSKERLVITVLMIVGLFMSLSGLLMAMYFNFKAVNVPLVIRLVGLGISLALIFIGTHILVVGTASLFKKST